MIWIFGDSWVEGAELWDDRLGALGSDLDTITNENNRPYRERTRWAGVMANMLPNTRIEVFGRSGCSNADICDILSHALTTRSEKPSLIIIAWTTQWRQPVYRTDWYKSNPPWRQTKRLPEYDDETTKECQHEFFNQVMLAHGVAHGIPIININAFNRNQTLLPLPEWVWFADNTLLGYATDNEISQVEQPEFDHHIRSYTNEYLKPHGHPSEMGHERIAKKVIEAVYKYQNEKNCHLLDGTS